MWRLAPLLAFLAVFGGTCFALEWRRVLLFTHPSAFWWTLVTPWFWWMSEAGYSGLPRTRALVALFTRLSIMGLFIMLLAEPRAVRENRSLSVVYALDISDSIGDEAIDEALKFVMRTAQGRPEKDEAGLVVLGRDAAVELPPRTAFPFETINSRITKDETNLAKGLSLAAAMLPEDRNGRLVLISDGSETTGDLNTALNELKSRGIQVDVLPIQYHYDREVWLEKLDLPRHVKQGETYDASVVLSALKDGEGTLTLEENGERIFEKRVRFNAGKNRFTMPVHMRGPGYYEYVARIITPENEDGWRKNNVAINYLYLRGKGRILMVRETGADERDWRPLADALRLAKFDLKVIDDLDFPRDALSLMPYDCVIFTDVPADCFDVAQTRAIRDAVYHQGAGFMMIGGKNSFGPGGYHRTPIEEILPVDMDITNKKVLPKGALVIVLHTCEFPSGNTWAKRIAKDAIRVLGADDLVGLLAYNYSKGDEWVFPLTPASEYENLVTKINKCEPGDMPSFVGTMKMGLQGLKSCDAAMKHMIIISDGDPQPPPPALIQKYVANKISVSTVLIDGYHQGSFQKVMRAIASSTKGRFYYVKNPNSLPSIFVKEAKTLKKSMIQNKTFVPRVEFDDGSILKGIEAFPPLHGYVLTSAKSDPKRCVVVLRGPDEDQLDPILAVGRYGVGKTAAFTSDFSSNWSKDWLVWDKFVPFVKQLVTSVARVSKEGNLRVRPFTSGNRGIVVVEDYHPDGSLLEMAARISGPREQSKSIKLRQTGPRRYRGEFELWGKGRYQVMVAASGEDRSEKALGGFVIPYSAEYLRFRSNPMVLKTIVERTGGKFLSGDEPGSAIFSKDRETRRSSRPIFDIFLAILACLIPLDVGIRRVQIDVAAIIRWIKPGKTARESTKTLGALLKRKESLETDSEKPMKPAFIPRPSRKPVPKPEAASKPEVAPKPSPSPASESTQSSEPSSTMERLLKKKRERGKK